MTDGSATSTAKSEALLFAPSPASASKAIAEMLAVLADQRSKLIKFRDSSHVRRFSETSTRQRSSLVTGLMHCSVRTGRRWNQELQYIIESTAPASTPRVCTAEERRAQVNALLESFRDEAAALAKKFIESYHFDADPADSPRSTLLSSDEQDKESGTHFAATDSFWATPEHESEGMALRVSLIDDPVVAKRAKREVQLQYLVLSQALELFPLAPMPITVYPQIVCRYAGHCVSVSALPGRTKAESLDCLSCPELALALEFVGESLNITSYDMVNDDGEENVRTGPPSASAFEGVDGRLYLETILGFLPHFPPARGAPITPKHTLFLRLEAVCASPEAVSPGAYVSYGGRHSRRLREQTTHCAKKLTLELVPRLAKELVTNPPPTIEDMLTSRLKPWGVNTALLGILLSHVHVASVGVRRLIFSEMAARALKTHLDYTHSDTLDVSISQFQQCCADICNQETQLTFFRSHLYERIVAGFPGTSALHAHILQSPFALIDTNLVIKRASKLTGYIFSPGVSNKGTSPFHFSVDRVIVRAQHVGVSPPVFAVTRTSELMDSISDSPNSHDALVPLRSELRPTAAQQRNRAAIFAAPNEDTSPRKLATVDLRTLIADLLRARATSSGNASFELAYEMLYASRRLEKEDTATALRYINQSLEILLSFPSRKVELCAHTLVQCHCQRAAVLIRMSMQEDAQRDLDDATTIIGSRALNTSASNGGRFSAFEDRDRRGSGGGMNGSAMMGNSGIARSQGQVKAIGARIFSLLADSLEAGGKFPEAETALQHVLQIQAALLGDVHASVGTAWGALGFNLLHQGPMRQRDAEAALKKDLEISEAIRGRDHPSVAETIGNLALLYDTMGRYDEAEALHRRDLQLTEKFSVAPATDLNLATSRTNLGITLCNRNEYVEAEPLLLAALETRLRVLGEMDKSVALSHTNLALVYLRLCESTPSDATLRKAESHALTAVRIIEQVCGKTHRMLRPALEHLKAIYARFHDGAKVASAQQHLESLVDA